MSSWRVSISRKTLCGVVVLALISTIGLPPFTWAQECAKIHEVIMTHVYTPKDLVITAGDCVRFVNRHTNEHSAIGRGRVFNTGTLLPRMTGLVKFDKPGEIPYACGLHPPMVGKLVVEPRN